MTDSGRVPFALSTTRRLTRRGVLWLGTRCDVRCKFCYDQAVKPADRVWIPYDEAVRAIGKFSRYYGNTYVDFMGGEPTLHPQVLALVEHATAVGLRVSLVTHGMHLSKPDTARAYADAGLWDCLVSIHGVGATAARIHQAGTHNFEKQMAALSNLRTVGIPFRFNCTVIRDNLTELVTIAELAGREGARVLNFLTFNPYFEWADGTDLGFQVRHSEAAPYLAEAIGACDASGIEANVRYMPPCQLRGMEEHVYTGFQLPYDPHEWDFNSWYDCGAPGVQSPRWYCEASQTQRQRHHYEYVHACGVCAVKGICDGFHAQYVRRWGGTEAQAYPGTAVTDPCHFVARQRKVEYEPDAEPDAPDVPDDSIAPLQLTQFSDAADHRAGLKAEPREMGPT